MVDGAGNLIYNPEHNRLGQNVSANPVVAKLISGQSGKEKIVNTLGVSSFPLDGMSAHEVLEHADQALYFAKGKGRNWITRNNMRHELGGALL
ncbi:hypothetical protein [Paenibacillus sp. V4I5]|uniref:hypothetical protein n=1 Tax=Paenibacillus sp. V4I5 TaxID=3042306 RepID=UPI0027D8DF5D|nr:hypothetical protein [Paenibacillus sp. V4I5]